MLGGTDGAPAPDEDVAEDAAPSFRAFVVDEHGQDDPEHATTRSVPRLQRQVAEVVDEHQMAELKKYFEANMDQHDHNLRRLADLQDKSVNHEWMWSLHPAYCRSLEPDVYVDAMRLRLGAGHGDTAVVCRVCCKHATPSGRHALCCAPGPSREGHDEVRDLVLAVARQGDPSAESEAVGLLPAAPGRRPADVLTSAAGGNGLTALDIGVASPDSLAAVANGDALEAMRKRKLGEYRYLEADLRAAGLQYKPIPWSCWGREHPDTSVVLEALARRAARRRGVADWRAVLRQLRGDINARIARRAALMFRQCFLRPLGEDWAGFAGAPV